QPLVVVASRLRPQAELDRRARFAVGAGERRRDAGATADEWRRPRHPEEGGRATAEPAGTVGAGAAAVAIKQGGYARRVLPKRLSSSHQCIDKLARFVSPTGPQIVCRGMRFVFANRLLGVKG